MGVQFFPRPHFELEAVYEKQKMAAVNPDNYDDYAWLMMHFYL